MQRSIINLLLYLLLNFSPRPYNFTSAAAAPSEPSDEALAKNDPSTSKFSPPSNSASSSNNNNNNNVAERRVPLLVKPVSGGVASSVHFHEKTRRSGSMYGATCGYDMGSGREQGKPLNLTKFKISGSGGRTMIATAAIRRRKSRGRRFTSYPASPRRS